MTALPTTSGERRVKGSAADLKPCTRTAREPGAQSKLRTEEIAARPISHKNHQDFVPLSL